MDLGGFLPRKNGANKQNKNISIPNPSSIPMLNQVMTAANGASRAFSGVAAHVNTSLKKIGAKNIEAGVGRGVGFGHGLGTGLSLKPGIVPRIQMQIMETMTKLMMKFRGYPNLSLGQGALVGSLQRGVIIPDMMRSNMARDKTMNTRMGSSESEGASLNLSTGTPSEKLFDSFSKDPGFKEEDTDFRRKDGNLQPENEVLQMVLKHQQVIEELIKENEMFRQILVEDLKIPSSKLRTTFSGKLGPPQPDRFEWPRNEREK